MKLNSSNKKIKDVQLKAINIEMKLEWSNKNSTIEKNSVGNLVGF